MNEVAPPEVSVNPVFGILIFLVGIGMLICWIMEIIAAFKKEEKPLMGILSIVGGLICTPLVPIIIGWIHAKKWGIKKVMMIWTILFVIFAILYGTMFATMFSTIEQMQ